MEKHRAIVTPVTDDEAAKTAVHFELLTNPVWPMPGQKKILSALRGNGIPCGDNIKRSVLHTPAV